MHVFAHTCARHTLHVHCAALLHVLYFIFLCVCKQRRRKRRRREVRAALGSCCTYCALSQINNSLHVYLTKGSWRAVEANPRYRFLAFLFRLGYRGRGAREGRQEEEEE